MTTQSMTTQYIRRSFASMIERQVSMPFGWPSTVWRGYRQRGHDTGRVALRRHESGFSLVEVSIVTALMVILAIIGIPALQDYVIENKVPKVASDLQRFVARMKVTALGGGETPYENVDQRVLINGLRGGSAISVRGEAPNGVVVHGLGGRGSKGNGEISLSPDAGPDMPTGSAFSLTLDHVNHAACPMLVSTLQRMAVLVKVAGKGGEVEVKNGFSSPVIPYQPVLADAQCQRGDSNRFVFVFQ